MADIERADQQAHPNLHLSPEERRYFGQLFAAADTDKLGVVTGEVAVKFFEKTKLSSDVLGEIWQIADTENRGLLTPAGFGIVLRLIGWAQAGRPVTSELALKSGGPLPQFDGIPGPPAPAASAAPLQPQSSGGPIRVPPLTQDKIVQFTALFEESGAQNGVLGGDVAKTIFERAQLPNELLGRIWNLADTSQRGSLGLSEFIVAMHLLTSFKNGTMRALPQQLPPGLYEAASRRGPARQGTNSRPTSAAGTAAPRQAPSQGFPNQPRPLPAGFQSPVQTGDQWLVTPKDKAQFDSIFSTVDTQNLGYITGDQAVTFFSNARLPEDALAQIWDLADINSEGRLTRDEFAVAMYLIRQQRAKRDGREVLPATLPEALVPPSLRRQAIPPPQPTAPVFDNASNISKPRSASDDLFGLDAISSSPAPAKAAEASNLTPTSPTRSQTLPAPAQPSQPPSHFKPFIPSSSFGQTIMTPQGTGTSAPASPPPTNRGLAASTSANPAMDDLLGDNDPEVSKRLTNETSELANLSSQVTTLTSQMSEVKNNRGATEQSLGQAQTQKREFEARLGQLRSAYQQEVKEVQTLQERLRISQEETKKLQSEMALIQGTHEDLQTQHQQVIQALTADQAEISRLKEKISQTNTELTDLKPRLEKAKLDARQQKGLVAIFKKQLAGNEFEREKIQGDLDGAAKEHAVATKELEESKQAIESQGQSTRDVAATAASPPVSSPSLNPFFRRPSGPTDKAATSPFTPPNVSSPNHNAFDSFFGPSAPAASGPPPTSFRTESPSITREGTGLSQVMTPQPLTDEDNVPTPSVSPPPSSFSDSPQTGNEPPAPPQSRQITSSFLPLRPHLDHTGSETSSVRVVPPASRMGGSSGSGADTPTNLSSDLTGPDSPKQHLEEVARKSGVAQDQDDGGGAVSGAARHSAGPSDVAQDLPGAFPGDEPEIDAHTNSIAPGTNSYGGSSIDPRIDSTPTASSQAKALTTAAPDAASSRQDHFDAAFDTMRNQGHGTAESGSEPKASDLHHTEFPPIRELGGDDDSDSDADNAFADDFTQGKGKKAAPMLGSLQPSGEGRPPFGRIDSNHSQLPTPGAQTSPPTYEQITGAPDGGLGAGDRKDSNQFPAEYSGLLPSREAPTSTPSSPPTVKPAVSTTTNPVSDLDPGSKSLASQPAPSSSTSGPALGKSISPMSPGASTTVPYAYTQTTSPPPIHSQPPVPPKTEIPKDDFDDEFGDLSEAKAASDHGEEDLSFSQNRSSDLDDFNPVFDSPAASRFAGKGGSQSSNFPHTDSFADFEAAPATGSVIHSTPAAGNSAAPASSHDWDAIFAGLDAPPSQNNSVGNDMDFSPSKPLQGNVQTNGTAPAPAPAAAAGVGVGKSPLNPAQTPKDENGDDPILKRLTGMGYPRDKSLAALEKYDYNIDKAAEYLISKS